MLEGIVAGVVHGRLLDLACGTAYWLPHYAANCPRITLFDQSDRMLAEARAEGEVRRFNHEPQLSAGRRSRQSRSRRLISDRRIPGHMATQ